MHAALYRLQRVPSAPPRRLAAQLVCNRTVCLDSGCDSLQQPCDVTGACPNGTDLTGLFIRGDWQPSAVLQHTRPDSSALVSMHVASASKEWLQPGTLVRVRKHHYQAAPQLMAVRIPSAERRLGNDAPAIQLFFAEYQNGALKRACFPPIAFTFKGSQHRRQ